MKYHPIVLLFDDSRTLAMYKQLLKDPPNRIQTPIGTMPFDRSYWPFQPLGFLDSSKAIKYISENGASAIIVQYNLNEKQKLERGERTFWDRTDENPLPQFEVSGKPLKSLEDAIDFAGRVRKIDPAIPLFVANLPREKRSFVHYFLRYYDWVIGKDYSPEQLFGSIWLALSIYQKLRKPHKNEAVKNSINRK